MASSPVEHNAATDWWELRLELPNEWAALASQALLDQGATGTQEDHPGLHFEAEEDGPIVSGDPRSWTPPVPSNPQESVLLKAWFAGTRDYKTLLEEVSVALEAIGVPTQGARLTALADQDWNANWKAGFTAFRLSRRLRIVPSWSNEEEEESGESLQLDPGMAFGTGTHFTTAGCTQLLDELLASWSGAAPALLDVGTGTGILALAGLRLGAASAVGVDADPRAIEASAENAHINGLTERLQLFEGGPEAAPPGTFPIVLANLIAPLLSELAPALCSRLAQGASLILSGILCSQEASIIETFGEHGLQTVQRLSDDEWVALRMTRRAGDPR